MSFWRLLESMAGSDSLEQPLAVHADLHTGEIFVCDQRTHRILIFDAFGALRYEIPGGNVFRTPMDVAVAPDGRIVLLAIHAGARRLIELDFDGREPSVLPLPWEEELETPPVFESVALDAEGELLYAADSANKAVWLLDREGGLIRRIDPFEDLTEEDHSEEILTRVDVYGEYLVLAEPRFGTARLLSLDGEFIKAVGLQGGAECKTGFTVAAALDREGRAYLLDRQKMLISVWRVADNVCLGEFSGIGDAPGRLYAPADIALDGDGRVYIGQGYKGRVTAFRGAAGALGGESRLDR